jgi:hypothetical protein
MEESIAINVSENVFRVLGQHGSKISSKSLPIFSGYQSVLFIRYDIWVHITMKIEVGRFFPTLMRKKLQDSSCV